MISKYNGICRHCRQPTKAGVDHYDLEAKSGYHTLCEEMATQLPDDEQLALAGKLGYKPYGDWHLLLLPREANGDPAWWDRSSASGRNGVSPMSASAPFDGIVAVGG